MSKIKVMAALVILLSYGSQVAFAQHKTRIIGRIVDGFNRPTNQAYLVLLPLDGMTGCTIEYHKPNADGRFQIEEDLHRGWEGVLYVKDVLPPNAHSLLDETSNQQLFTGYRVSIGKEDEIVLGDLPVKTFFGEVLVRVEYPSGKPVFEQTSNSDWFEVRIRDKKGDIVNEIGSPLRHYLQTASTLSLWLPLGEWSLEFDLGDVAPGWLPLANSVHVRAPRQSQRFNLIAANKHDPDKTTDLFLGSSAALQELNRLNIAFTTAAFIQRAAKGNVRAVKLFIAAGMDVNTPGDNGDTALIAGASHEEIVGSLLDAGALTNVANKTGTTPLIIAAATMGYCAGLFAAKFNHKAGDRRPSGRGSDA